MSLHLDDERVDAMRRRVFNTVQHDAARRGRRLRRTLQATAGLCLVAVIGGTGSALVSSSRQPSSSSSLAARDAPSTHDDSRGSKEYAAGGGTVQEGAAQDSVPEQVPEKNVITTGTVNATVRDVQATEAALEAWVKRHDGRIDDQSRSGSGATAAASVTVRVPAPSVRGVVDEIGRNGRIDDVSITRRDVGTQRRDLDARIDALKISVDRLQKIMAQADRSSDLLAAERSLSQRQASLESLEAQRRALTDRVDLATINVELTAKASAQAPSEDGFTSGLVDGWNAFVSVVSGLVRAAGFTLPWIVVAAVAGFTWAFVRRRRRGRSGPDRRGVS